MKNKNLFVRAIALVGSVFSLSYPFFRLTVYAGDKKEKKSQNKWFRLNHTKVNHPSYGYEEEYNAVKKWCEEQDMEDVYITSYDGLKLHAKYFPAKKPERLVILAHGYRGSSFGSIAHMAEFLHDKCCSLLFIDQRCCGESEGEYITFGAKEQYDILSWLKYLKKRNPDRKPVYLYGQSMGATTVILAAGNRLPSEVKGVISDCGFHSMKQQLRDMAGGWFHLHFIGFLLFRVDILCRRFAFFRMKDADTTEALKKNKLPILFFHGDKDTYVIPGNSEKNYQICRAPKELVIVPGARHLCSSYADPKLYKRKLTEFFGNND